MTQSRRDSRANLAGRRRAESSRASTKRHRPLLIAIAERLAAERYRGWAKETAMAAHAARAARVRRPRGGDRGPRGGAVSGRRGDPARDAREASRSRGREPIACSRGARCPCSSGSRRTASASAPPPGAPSPSRSRAAPRATPTSPARSSRKPARWCSNRCSEAARLGASDARRTRRPAAARRRDRCSRRAIESVASGDQLGEPLGGAERMAVVAFPREQERRLAQARDRVGLGEVRGRGAAQDRRRARARPARRSGRAPSRPDRRGPGRSGSAAATPRRPRAPRGPRARRARRWRGSGSPARRASSTRSAGSSGPARRCARAPPPRRAARWRRPSTRRRRRSARGRARRRARADRRRARTSDRPAGRFRALDAPCPRASTRITSQPSRSRSQSRSPVWSSCAELEVRPWPQKKAFPCPRRRTASCAPRTGTRSSRHASEPMPLLYQRPPPLASAADPREACGARCRNSRSEPTQPADREAIRRICFETGYMGESIEWIWRDRESFADLITRYYTDREPESIFVATRGDRRGRLSHRLRRQRARARRGRRARSGACCCDGALLRAGLRRLSRRVLLDMRARSRRARRRRSSTPAGRRICTSISCPRAADRGSGGA